jgi:hypothetical protein
MESKTLDMNFGGQTLPPQAIETMKAMVVTSTYDKTGHTMSTEISGVPDAVKAQMQQSVGGGSTATFPDHPVKPGDTWTAESNVQSQKVKMTFKYVKSETVNGMNAAVLEATPDETAKAKFDGPMTIKIETATGLPIEMTANIVEGDKKAKMTMTRQ